MENHQATGRPARLPAQRKCFLSCMLAGFTDLGTLPPTGDTQRHDPNKMSPMYGIARTTCIAGCLPWAPRLTNALYTQCMKKPLNPQVSARGEARDWNRNERFGCWLYGLGFKVQGLEFTVAECCRGLSGTSIQPELQRHVGDSRLLAASRTNSQAQRGD